MREVYLTSGSIQIRCSSGGHILTLTRSIGVASEVYDIILNRQLLAQMKLLKPPLILKLIYADT